MTSCNHMCCHSCNGSQEPFSTRQCTASHGKGVTKLSPHCYFPSLAYPTPRFVSNRAYLGSFGTASCAFHDFERTREPQKILRCVSGPRTSNNVKMSLDPEPQKILRCVSGPRTSNNVKMSLDPEPQKS
ncbi:uncharacterized protein TNCV_3646091 [Trichonephila clavipes]|nr:uncharacterized protein TNCV_3646091 [Trichonephila clavipes]